MKRKRGRSKRVPNTTFAVTLFSLTGLKLTKQISYTGSGEMWTRFSFWRVPVSARFQGITAARACLLIYCAKHRFISETAGYIECFTVSHTCLPSLHPPHWNRFNTVMSNKCLRIWIYCALQHRFVVCISDCCSFLLHVILCRLLEYFLCIYFINRKAV